MWARSSLIPSSCLARRTTTSRWWSTYASSISRSESVLGTPSTSATALTPKVACIEVCL